MEKKLKTIANINIVLGVLLLIAPIGILIYYIFFGNAQRVDALPNSDRENEIITQPIFTDKSQLGFKDPFGDFGDVKPLQFNVPNYEALDIGTKINIDSIGLNTTVFESTSPTLGLEAGVWRDPLYGVPDRKNSGPIVLAAHRWGQDWFSWEYRYENLFTKFDQLKVNQEVSLTWNGKEYKYKIRKVEEGTNVTESADLIMYTCIYYNSPERIFVYADRVN